MDAWAVIAQQGSPALLGAVGGGLVGAAVALRALRVYSRQLNTMQDQVQTMRLTQTKETADALFREWWGREMNLLRRYFYLEFLPKHYAKEADGDLKELEHRVADDKGQLMSLTGFFDRVGWLGAAGLVDVDYVLGPMQHTMRRVWLATERLISRTREVHPPGQLDPVYRLGFEWLFRRSEEKSQAILLVHRFSDPALFSRNDAIQTLKFRIQDDEREFRQYLESLRGKARAG